MSHSSRAKWYQLLAKYNICKTLLVVVRKGLSKASMGVFSISTVAYVYLCNIMHTNIKVCSFTGKYVFMQVFRHTYVYTRFSKIQKYFFFNMTYSKSTNLYFQNTTSKRANTLMFGLMPLIIFSDVVYGHWTSADNRKLPPSPRSLWDDE